MKYWQDIDVEMMPEEESCEDIFIRHPPKYRSETLAKIIEKLDKRNEKRKTAQPRKKRVIGTPQDTQVPPNGKNWTLKKEFRKATSKNYAYGDDKFVCDVSDNSSNYESETECDS